MAGGLDVGRAPSNWVVLPFYGTGAIAFFTLTILMFLSSFPLMGGYFEPHILAIVHTAALGWGTMVIFGAAYQLLPVICESDLYSEKAGIASYFFLAFGAACLIICFWLFQTGFWMLTGGCLLLIAGGLYFYNVVKTVGKKFWKHIQKLFLFTSACWLLLTMTIGILLAINLQYPFITSHNHLEILKLHAHAGLAGWFLELIVGISAKLIPMFLLSHIKKDYLLQRAYWLINSGLVLFLLDGYFFGASFRYLIYTALVIAGVLFWLAYIREAYKHKIKKPDFSMKHSFLAFSSLLLALALIPVIYYADNGKWVILYGLFLFIGWISSLILGMTFKTLPFIVWNNTYRMLNGKMKIPLPKDLLWGKLLQWQFQVFVASLYVIALSLIFENHLFLQVGLGLLFITGLAYVINTFKVLTHKKSKNLEKNGI